MISSDSVAFWAYMTVEYVSAFIILSLLTPLEDCAFYDRLRRGAVWRTNVEDWNSSLGAVLVYKTNGSGRGEGQGSLEEAGADHRRRGASLCANRRGGSTVKTPGVVLGTRRLGQAERQLPRVHLSGISEQFVFFYSEYYVTCSQGCRLVPCCLHRRIYEQDTRWESKRRAIFW